MSEPSPAAVDAGSDLVFEALVEQLDFAASYARSGREAAWRGSREATEVHLKQLRLCIVEALQTFRELPNP